MASKWSKKTYQLVAEVLHPGCSGFRNTDTIKLLAWEFSARFQADDPRFDRDRFLKAIFEPEEE